MRAVVVGVGLVVVPSVLIGVRLFTQLWALSGPPSGSGTIEGDTVRVASRVGARLLALEVKEGDDVEPDAVIARLDCREPEAALAEARANLEAARARSRAAEEDARAAGVQTSSAQIGSRAAAAQADALAAQRDAASRQAERVAALDDGASRAILDQSATSASALRHQTDAAAAQAESARLQVGLARGKAAAAAAAAEAAADSVRAVEAAVARAELLVGECVVRAPRGGRIETLPFAAGEIVPPGQPLAVLVDARVVTATFWLPDAELADVKVGDVATVEADAWDDRTFPATVGRIGAEAAFTPRNVQTRTDRDRLVYPVEVRLENPDGALRPGMPVTVRVGE